MLDQLPLKQTAYMALCIEGAFRTFQEENRYSKSSKHSDGIARLEMYNRARGEEIVERRTKKRIYYVNDYKQYFVEQWTAHGHSFESGIYREA